MATSAAGRKAPPRRRRPKAQRRPRAQDHMRPSSRQKVRRGDVGSQQHAFDPSPAAASPSPPPRAATRLPRFRHNHRSGGGSGRHHAHRRVPQRPTWPRRQRVARPHSLAAASPEPPPRAARRPSPPPERPTLRQQRPETHPPPPAVTRPACPPQAAALRPTSARARGSSRRDCRWLPQLVDMAERSPLECGAHRAPGNGRATITNGSPGAAEGQAGKSTRR